MSASTTNDFTDWLCKIHARRVRKELAYWQKIVRRAAELAETGQQFQGWSKQGLLKDALADLEGRMQRIATEA